MKVVIDGVPYIPVSEVPAAAELCTLIAETFWGKDSKEASDPAKWRETWVDVTHDDGSPWADRNPTLEEFVAQLLERKAELEAAS